MEEELTIQEVAARTGLSVHTLRYYERIGLLDPVGRATSGHRRYAAGDLNWIAFLVHLRATGMSIRQMLAFADLRRQGEVTMPERLALLEAHQRQVWEHVHKLEGHLAVIEEKMQINRRMLAGERKSADRDRAGAPYCFPMTTQRKEEEIVLFS
jgi:DNA-binding transcriptional MerR regulator